MTTIQQEIQDTMGQIVHLNKVSSQLETTSAELETAYAQQEKLMKTLQKELKDIEKLEGLSTTSIFYKILGSKEKQVEKERQEYLELSLKYEEVEKTIELLEYEVNLLEAKVGSKEELNATLERLKLRREEEIIKSDPKLRTELMSISTALESQYVLSKEIQEAQEVAQICHNLLTQMINQLSKVRNWGQWPQSRNRTGSMHRQSVMRDAIDRARNLSYQIKHHLNLLDKELMDLGQRLEMDVNTESMSNFSTFFFNNLITDWILNQQLTQAVGSAARARDQIKYVIDQLAGQLQQSSTEIAELRSSREQVLMM